MNIFETTLDKLHVGDRFCIQADFTPKPNSGVRIYEIVEIVNNPEKLKNAPRGVLLYYYRCRHLNNELSDAPTVKFAMPHPSLSDIERLKLYVLKICSVSEHALA